jgi:hypothetical protein
MDKIRVVTFLNRSADIQAGVAEFSIFHILNSNKYIKALIMLNKGLIF